MKNQAKKSITRWYRMNLWIHRWVSLVVVIPFAILCITGVILIFHEEIDHALGYVPEATHANLNQQRPPSDSLAVAQQTYPDRHVVAVAMEPEDHPNLLLIGMAKDKETLEQAKWLFADMTTATLTEMPNERHTLTGFLLELHSQWFLGMIGELIGALIALLVFLSLVSGMVVYAPYIKKVLFGVIRRQKGQRIFQLDLHNLMGSVILGWALVVTISGFLLGFSAVATGIWQMTELKHLQNKYAHVTTINPDLRIEQVFQAAIQHSKDWTPTTIIYPKTEYSTQGHYLVLLQGKEGIHQKMVQVALIDANTGQLTTIEQAPFYLKAIFLSQPLHFGNYGGLPLKILWTLCTLLTLFITVNGAWLWWARRNSRKTRSDDLIEEITE